MTEFGQLEKDDYTWRVTDTAQAVHELSILHESAGGGKRFIHNAIQELQKNEEHRRSQGIIERFAEIALARSKEEYFDHFSGKKVPVAPYSMPPLLNHPSFEEGFAVGSYMAYHAVHQDAHHLLTEKVHALADMAGDKPQAFAYVASHIGNTTITQGVVHPDDPAYGTYRNHRNPLHTFVNQIRHELYDDPLHRINFKIGAGLAQRAYIDYCWDVRKQFDQVVTR